MIEVENVTYGYKESKIILNNLSFRVNDGEILAIVGKNGSGKSTIGKLIAGILKLKKGKIVVDGLEISNKKAVQEIRKKIGIVFQNPENQIIFNTIKDEVAFCLNGLEEEQIEKRLQDALQKVEMLEWREKDLYQLSLGQKQRMVIAEVLAKEPKYLILDEPTTMIDSLGKEKIYQIIKDLKKQGYTIICITNLADEMLLADRVLVLEEGKIALEIEKQDLPKKIEELKSYEIKIPILLEMVAELKQNGVELELEEYNVKNFVNSLKGKLKL